LGLAEPSLPERCLFQECSDPIALPNAKHRQNFLKISHDNQQVSAWVQQEKQNVGENFTKTLHPFPQKKFH
jgi:hypothetical protein